MIEEKLCYLDVYENVREELKFLTNSEIRVKILKCLSELPIPMKNLCNTTNLTYSAISNNIHRLEDEGYVTSDSGKFSLNNVAVMKLLNFVDFNESVGIVKNYIDLWADHDITGISVDDLTNLNSLKKSYLVESIPTDIYRPHNLFKKILTGSDNIKAIFPFIHPDYPVIFEDLINKGVNVELLCGKSITVNFIESMDIKVLKKGSKSNHLKIKSSKEDIKLFLTISDDHMVFGLFKEDGTFDQNRLLISNEMKAIEWGNKLFDSNYSIGNNLYI
jgi:predicted transcriptional regulator